MATVRCCICFGTVGSDDDGAWVVLTACGHALHEECLYSCKRRDTHLKCPLCQAEVRQDPDSQAKKILRQNYPHRCFLDAEKLKSGDEVLPDLSLPAEPDELMVKLVRDMHSRFKQQEIRADVATAQAEELQERLSEEASRLQAEKKRNTDVQRKSMAALRDIKAKLAHEFQAKRDAESSQQQLQQQLRQLMAEQLSHRLSDPTCRFTPEEFSDELKRLGQLTGSSVNDTLQKRAERSDLEYTALINKYRSKTEALSASIDALSKQNANLLLEKQKAELAVLKSNAAAARSASASAMLQPQQSQQRFPAALHESNSALPAPAPVQAETHTDDDCVSLDLLCDDPSASEVELQRVSSKPSQAGPSRGILGTPGASGGGFLGRSNGFGASFLGKATTGTPGASLLGSSNASGSFILHGPDGKGGTARVLAPSAANRQAASNGNFNPFLRPTGTKRATKSIPQIQRRKGPGSRGGAALKISDFMDRENGPPVRFS